MRRIGTPFNHVSLRYKIDISHLLLMLYRTTRVVHLNSLGMARALLLQNQVCQEEEQCLSKRYSSGERLAF